MTQQTIPKPELMDQQPKPNQGLLGTVIQTQSTAHDTATPTKPGPILQQPKPKRGRKTQPPQPNPELMRPQPKSNLGLMTKQPKSSLGLMTPQSNPNQGLITEKNKVQPRTYGPQVSNSKPIRTHDIATQPHDRTHGIIIQTPL